MVVPISWKDLFEHTASRQSSSALLKTGGDTQATMVLAESRRQMAAQSSWQKTTCSDMAYSRGSVLTHSHRHRPPPSCNATNAPFRRARSSSAGQRLCRFRYADGARSLPEPTGGIGDQRALQAWNDLWAETNRAVCRLRACALAARFDTVGPLCRW